MITFRHVSDSLGSAHFFQVDGRSAGYVSQSLDGTFTVFFADMADAPTGVTLERSTAPGSTGIFATGLATLDDALALVRRTYAQPVAARVPVSASFAASRVPSVSAPAVTRSVPVAFPTPTPWAAFYSPALTRPLLDAQRPSTTPTRNTQ